MEWRPGGASTTLKLYPSAPETGGNTAYHLLQQLQRGAYSDGVPAFSSAFNEADSTYHRTADSYSVGATRLQPIRFAYSRPLSANSTSQVTYSAALLTNRLPTPYSVGGRCRRW